MSDVSFTVIVGDTSTFLKFMSVGYNGFAFQFEFIAAAFSSFCITFTKLRGKPRFVGALIVHGGNVTSSMSFFFLFGDFE